MARRVQSRRRQILEPPAAHLHQQHGLVHRFTGLVEGERSGHARPAVDRVQGRGEAVETPIGFVPKATAIDTNGLALPAGAMDELLRVNKDDWTTEIAEQKKFFEQFGNRLPKEIREECEALEKRFGI
jgi:phosphoenolpyruvate carboxykinase (GTP)